MVSRCHGRGPRTQNRAPCGAKARSSCAMADMTMSCAVEDFFTRAEMNACATSELSRSLGVYATTMPAAAQFRVAENGSQSHSAVLLR